jgi:ABC-type transport system substrate-binding protein
VPFASDEGTVAALEAQLADVGLQVDHARLAGASLAAALEGHLVDAAVVEQGVASWGAEPYPLLEGLLTGLASVGIDLPEAQEALAAARAATSPRERAQHYRAVEQVLLASVPAVPLALAHGAPPSRFVVAPGVQPAGLGPDVDFARTRLAP